MSVSASVAEAVAEAVAALRREPSLLETDSGLLPLKKFIGMLHLPEK